MVQANRFMPEMYESSAIAKTGSGKNDVPKTGLLKIATGVQVSDTNKAYLTVKRWPHKPVKKRYPKFFVKKILK